LKKLFLKVLMSLYDDEGVTHVVNEDDSFIEPAPELSSRIVNPPTVGAIFCGILWMHITLIFFPLAAIIMGVIAWATKAPHPDGKECSMESNNCGFLRECGLGVNSDQPLCTAQIVFYGLVLIPSLILFAYVIFAVLMGDPKRKGMIQAIGNSLWLHWGFPFYAFIALM